MYKVVKATLLLKKSLRKRVADKEYSKNTVYLQNVHTYKIFSPRTLHCLLLNESFTASIIKPISKRIWGAILFADISGFTRLSARLDSEELKLHINLYFSLVLGVVNKFAGDVIKFCGDAIIVLWPLEQNCDLETQFMAVELALKCSLQLLRVCGRYDKNLSNDRPPVSLRLHCGVSCGYIHSMCLGAGDRWEYLIAGPPMKQVGIAASEAGTGEVCISREVQDHVCDIFQLEKMPLGSYKILGMRTLTSHHELSSSFFVGELMADTIRKTPSGTTAVKSTTSDSTSESVERKTPSIGSVALVKGLSGRLVMNLQKRQEGTPEPRNSGPGNRSLMMAAAQMAAIWSSAQDTLNTRASRRKSATIAPSIDDYQDVTKQTQTMAYLDAPIPPESQIVLANNIPQEAIPDPVGFAQRLRFFVHDGARDAIEQNCLSYLAELRQVVTMFIEILDLEEDFSQGLLQRPQFVSCTILNCLGRFGGSLRQFVIDDKGFIAIAAFGLSGSSHEDNSIRAVETALRIRHILNGDGISVRFGVTSGRVFCGLVGTGDRCEYAMMGSSVNLAARFMSNAPANEMIVSHEIYIETLHEFEYNHLTKIIAKGYDNPVPAYSPTKRISGNLSKKLNTTHSLFELKDINLFIGRTNALDNLRSGFESFIADTPPAVPLLYSILGPPGYGKTWVLNKFLKDVSGLPEVRRIYSIAADEAHANKRYYCLRLLFNEILHTEFESQTSVQDLKILISQGSSQGVERYRKLISASKSMLFSTVEEDTAEFTSLLKKWIEVHCPKLMMKDLNIGKEIYECDNQRKGKVSHTDDMVSDRVVEGLTRHTLIIDILPCLEGILPVESSFNPIVSSMSHWARIKLSHQIVLRILELALLKQGIIVTLENLQWCDAPTLDILHLLFTKNLCPAFVLITARSVGQEHNDQANQPSPNRKMSTPSLPPNPSSRMCRSAQMLVKLSNKCVLEPFTTDDIREMIDLILTQQYHESYGDLLTPESLTKIHQRTGGVPYLTTSLMMSLRESVIHNSFHGIDSLPTGEHNIIVNRFDKLTSTEQLILKVATVIGDTFTFDFLSQVLKCMGDGLVSASIGLESTLHRLQSSSLVVQVIQESSLSLSRSSVLDSLTSEDLSTTSTSSLCFQFTARNIKECIYNLMLQSQRESVHAIVGRLLERQWGALPELNFFEIAKHYYASNNFQKKIMYLEESLRRAQGDNDPDLMKDSLHHLLLITVGYNGDALIQHCFAVRNRGRRERSTQTLLQLPFVRTDQDEEPLLESWLTCKHLRNEITLLEGINLTQSEKAVTDPFAVSYNERAFSTRDKSISSGVSEKTGGQLPSPGKTIVPAKIITIKNIFSWVSQLVHVQFGLGNFKQSHNLGILLIHQLDLSVPKPSIYYDSITDFMYQVKGYFRSFRSPQVSAEYIRYILKTFLVLAQIHLLRGQTCPADECLNLLNSLSLENQSPSEIFEFQILGTYLSVLKGERVNTILDFFGGIEPTEESIYQYSSIGLYYFLKCFVELSVGDVTKALLSSKNALTQYEKSENTLFTYSAMVLRGWCNLFACKLDDSTQIALDSSLYATISQGIPLLLHKWGVELLIVNKLVKGDLDGAQVEWDKLQSLNRNNMYSPTSCSLFATLNVMRGQYIDAAPFARYACQKLSRKQYSSPAGAIFLFYAGYSALRIIEYCRIETIPEFRKHIEMSYERVGIPYKRIPQDVESPRKKLSDRDYKSIIDLLLPCVHSVIKRFESIPQSIRIAEAFGFILNFMKRRIMIPGKSLMTCYSSHSKYFSDGKFAFGLFYFRYEAALHFSSRDNKQAHTEALRAYEAAQKLIASSNISVSDLSISPAAGKFTDIQDFVAAEFENEEIESSSVKSRKALSKINEISNESKEDRGMTIITSLDGDADDSLQNQLQFKFGGNASEGKSQNKYLPEAEESKLEGGGLLILTNLD